MEIDGDTKPDDGSHGQLLVDGDVSLDGMLKLQTDVSFTPNVEVKIGNTFVILTTDSITNQFSTVNGRHVGNGLFYNVVYNSMDVTLGAF